MSAAAQLTPAVPKPAHVPDALVYDFDAYRDPGLLANPHERIARMVKEAPRSSGRRARAASGSSRDTRRCSLPIETSRRSPARWERRSSSRP